MQMFSVLDLHSPFFPEHKALSSQLFQVRRACENVSHQHSSTERWAEQKPDKFDGLILSFSSLDPALQRSVGNSDLQVIAAVLTTGRD